MIMSSPAFTQSAYAHEHHARTIALSVCLFVRVGDGVSEEREGLTSSIPFLIL